MRKWMLLSFGVCLGVSASAAPLLVDDFSSLAPQSVSQTGVGSSDNYASGGTMLGGSRALVATVDTSNYGLASSISVIPGVGAVSDNFGNAGRFWLGYLGTGVTGTGGIYYSGGTNSDFSAFDGIEVDMTSSDKPFTLRAFLISDASFATWEKAYGVIGSPTTVSVTAADYVGGFVDMSNVDLLVMEFETEVDGDLALTEIRLVPEPATLATVGLGVLAMMRRRRKA